MKTAWKTGGILFVAALLIGVGAFWLMRQPRTAEAEPRTRIGPGGPRTRPAAAAAETKRPGGSRRGQANHRRQGDGSAAQP